MPSHTLHSRLQALRTGSLDEAGQRQLFEDALAEGDQAVACETADHLAYALLDAGRPAEAREVAERALAAGPDFALLHTLALAEHAMGDSAQAIGHLEQALQQLGEPREDTLRLIRADMLEHLATLCRQQGKGLRAWQALEQAASLLESLDDHAGWLRCEIALARLARELGDNTQSADKWLTVIEIARRAGRAEDEARALLELAEIARDEGHAEAEESLRQEAIEALVRARLWPDLACALFQLGRTRSRRDAVWQALWLMLALEGPMEGLINAQAWLFMREDQKALPEAARLAAAVIAVIEKLPSSLPLHPELHRMAITTFLGCARLQGIHETEITAWMEKERLRAEDGIIATTMKMIEEHEETGEWLFDRALFLSENSS
jgi:tetratricopeptide (TPR) repeat protein